MSVVEVFSRRWLGPPPLQQQTPLWLLHPDNPHRTRRRYSEEWYFLSRHFLALPFRGEFWQMAKLCWHGPLKHAQELRMRENKELQNIPYSEIQNFYDKYGIDSSLQSADESSPGFGVPHNLYNYFPPAPELYPMSQIHNEAEFYLIALPEQKLLAQRIACRLVGEWNFSAKYFQDIANSFDDMSFFEKLKCRAMTFSRRIDKYTPELIGKYLGPVYDFLLSPQPDWLSYTLCGFVGFFALLRIEPFHFMVRPTLPNTTSRMTLNNQYDAIDKLDKFTKTNQRDSWFWSIPNLVNPKGRIYQAVQKPLSWVQRKLGVSEWLPEISNKKLAPEISDFPQKDLIKEAYDYTKSMRGGRREFSTSTKIFENLKHRTFMQSRPQLRNRSNFSMSSRTKLQTPFQKTSGSFLERRSFAEQKEKELNIDFSKVKYKWIQSDPYQIDEKELTSLIKKIGGKIPEGGLKMPPRKVLDAQTLEQRFNENTPIEKIKKEIEMAKIEKVETPVKGTQFQPEMDVNEAYKILGLSQEQALALSQEEFDQLFNSLSMRVHPDLGSGTKLIAQKVNEAFDHVKKVRKGSGATDVKHGSRFEEQKMGRQEEGADTHHKRIRKLSEDEKMLRSSLGNRQSYVRNRLHELSDSGGVMDSWTYVSMTKSNQMAHPKFRPWVGFRSKVMRDYVIDPLFSRFYPTAEEKAAQKDTAPSKTLEKLRWWYSKFTKAPPPF